MTAEALLMRQYLGWRRDHPEMIAGGQLAAHQNLPQYGTATDVAAQRRSQRLLLVLRHAGHVPDAGALLATSGTRGCGRCCWKARRQAGRLAGSWDPVRPVPDRYGYMVGRLYVTAHAPADAGGLLPPSADLSNAGRCAGELNASHPGERIGITAGRVVATAAGRVTVAIAAAVAAATEAGAHARRVPFRPVGCRRSCHNFLRISASR